MATNTKPHVVIIPSPGMGHLIPLVEFAKLLHFNHHFSISLLLPSSSPPTAAQTAFLAALPPAISHTYLPPVDPTLLPSNNVDHEIIIHLIHTNSLPSFRSTLASLSSVVAVVTDLFGTDYFDAARDLGVPSYIYFTTNAFCLMFLLDLPRLHETVSCEFRDMEHPVLLPGCVPLYGSDFVDPAQNRQGESYRVLLHHVKRYTLAKGIFLNTFLDLEPDAIHALRTDPRYYSTRFYPVGPVIQSGSSEGQECLTWLDQQPSGSVLYVSFGSGGTLSHEQISELAIGLEKSGQRFLWVVRPPSSSSSGSFFTQSGTSGNDSKPFGFLPDGYLGRIKDRGLLVPSWAPQIKVLSHGSTEGFLTHCGWNSILESIVNGVPLITWPLYAEQKMNAVLLNEGLKVGLRPKQGESGIVEAEDIASVVKELMEGDEGKIVRERMEEFRELARKTRGQDGNSTITLNQVAQEWSSSNLLAT